MIYQEVPLAIIVRHPPAGISFVVEPPIVCPPSASIVILTLSELNNDKKKTTKYLYDN